MATPSKAPVLFGSAALIEQQLRVSQDDARIRGRFMFGLCVGSGRAREVLLSQLRIAQ